MVEGLEEKQGLLELTISSKQLIQDLKVSNSISIDGCCQTIIDKYLTSFKVQSVEETLLKTNLRSLKIGSKVNLELSLRLSDRLDGHLVLGHVDDVGEVSSILASEENKITKISFPERLKRFIVPKGSIAVNGVSLTVVDVKNSEFSFTLIPFTRDNTNLGLLKKRDLVNLEVDLIGRYVINYLESKKDLVV